ncbi:hypothetical protein B9Z19DRAFT_1067443 [Tuber borchii]|uniref:Uncharacterized protein n=1 Tax=Tuber borchii TaxID=42251 RepID=A0A2T6ZIV2_TUBBO|nr:hypothetical protein B9Z19DRAFT_1067443 [Tuber borchii]
MVSDQNHTYHSKANMSPRSHSKGKSGQISKVKPGIPLFAFVGPSLFRVKRLEYLYPSGSLDFLHFRHSDGSVNNVFRINNNMCAAVNSAKVSTSGEVDVAVSVALAAYGHTQPDSSFVPSQTMVASSVETPGEISPVIESTGLVCSRATILVRDSQPAIAGIVNAPHTMKHFSSVSTPALVPSGFNSEGLDGPCVRPALPLSRRYHEFIAHTRERRGNTPDRITVSPSPDPQSPLLLTTSQIILSQAVIVRDTPMDLGGGSNSNNTGLGDSWYATQVAASSQAMQRVPSLVVPSSLVSSLRNSVASPSLSSLVPLPPTIESITASPATVGILMGLGDNEAGRSQPQSDSDSDMGSVDSSAFSPPPLCGGKPVYDNLLDITNDVKYWVDKVHTLRAMAAKCINELNEAVEKLTREVTDLQAQNTHNREKAKTRTVTSEAMAKVMNPDSPARAATAVASPHPILLVPASAPTDRKVSFDVAEGKRRRRRNQNRKWVGPLPPDSKSEDWGAVPTTETAPYLEHCDVQCPSCLLTGAAMYSRVVAAPPPLPIPISTRPCTPLGWTGRASGEGNVGVPLPRFDAFSPTRNKRITTSSPSPSAREGHITMHFVEGKRTQLPVTPEEIRIRLNQSLSNQRKVAGASPYFQEVRARLEIVCIFLTLAIHTADQVWGRLDKCRATLLREFGPAGLTNFSFAKDVLHIKLLVSGIPLAPTSHGSVWRIDDWTRDKAYDGVHTDLEGSNRGCPVLAAASASTPAGAVTPIVADNFTATGVSDRSQHQERHHRAGHHGTPMPEVFVTEGIGSGCLAHCKLKGKGKASQDRDNTLAGNSSSQYPSGTSA